MAKNDKNKIIVTFEGVDNLSKTIKNIEKSLKKVIPAIEKLDKSLLKLSKRLTSVSEVQDVATKKGKKELKDYVKEAQTTIDTLSKLYKKAEFLGDTQKLSKSELGRIGALKKQLKTLYSKIPEEERKNLQLEEFFKVETTKERIRKRLLEKRLKEEEQKEKEKIEAVRRRWQKSFQSAREVQWKNFIKTNFEKEQKARSIFFQTLHRNSENYAKNFFTSQVRLIENSSKQVSKDIQNITSQISTLYDKARSLGGLEKLPFADKKKLSELKRQLQDLYKVAPKDIQNKAFSQFQKLRTKEISLIKQIKREEEKATKERWQKSFQSAKETQLRNFIKANFEKEQRARSIFFQSLNKNSENYARRFFTSRVRLIENSSKQISKNIQDIVNQISALYDKAKTLGGLDKLPFADKKRLSELKKQLQDLYKVAPKDIQNKTLSQFERLKTREISLIKRVKKEEEKFAKERLRNSIQSAKAIKHIQDMRLKMEKENIKTVWNSYKIKERTLKKELLLLERQLNAINQIARARGVLSFKERIKSKALLKQYELVGAEAVKQGVIRPEEYETKLKRLNAVLDNTSERIGVFNSLFHEWWIRFGAVALGFTVVYRLFNYLELGIGALIDKIREGILAFDNFQESASRLALFYRIFGKNTELVESVKYSTNAIEGLRYAMVTALSPIEDIMQGIDELAQHGVFLSASMMKDFVNFTDFIGMIAKTTGSQANQIRQELQALFEGTKRAGNTLIRFIYKAFGKEAVDKIQNSTSAFEQYVKIMKLISGEVEKFKKPLMDKSFTFSLTVTLNLFRLLVVEAEELANQFKYGSKDANIFARTIQKVSERLGLNLYSKINDLKLQLSHQLRLFKEGKETRENIEKTRKELERLYSQFENTPARKTVESLSRLMVTFADVMEKVANVIPDIIIQFENLINYVKSFYSRFKTYFDAIFDLIKYMLLLKTISFGMRFVFLEPLRLLSKLISSVYIRYKDLYFLFTDTKAFSIFRQQAKAGAVTGLKSIQSALNTTTRKLYEFGMVVMPTFTTFVYNSFVSLSKRLKKLKVGDRIASVLMPKSLGGLIARLSVVIALVWGVLYTKLHPEKAKNLGKSFLLSLALGIVEIQSFVLTKIGDVIDTIMNFFLDKLKQVSNLLIELNKKSDKLVPDFVVDIAKKIKSFEFKGGKNLAEIYNQKVLNPIKEAIQKELNKTGSLKDNFVDFIKTSVSDFEKGISFLKPYIDRLKKKLYELLGIPSFEGKEQKLRFLVSPEIEPKTNVQVDYAKIIEDKLNRLKDKLEGYDLISKVFGLEKVDALKQQLAEVRKSIDEISEILYIKEDVQLTEEERRKYELEYLRLLGKEKDLVKEINDLTGKGLSSVVKRAEILANTFEKLVDLDFLKKKNISVQTYHKTVSEILKSLYRLRTEYQKRLKEATPDERTELQERYTKVQEKISELKEKKKEIDIQLSDTSALQTWLLSMKEKFTEIGILLEKNRIKIQSMDRLINGAFQKTSDLLYDALTGKLKTFKDFIFALRDVVLKAIYDMASAFIQLKLQQTLFSNFISSTSTSAFVGGGKSVNFGTFAEGGIVTKPTLGLIGEAGYPEAVIPLKNGRIPVDLGTQNTGQPVIVLNVNAVDVHSFVRYKKEIIEIMNEGIKKGMLTNNIRRIV